MCRERCCHLGRYFEQERRWLTPRIWVGPLVLTIVLLAELLYALASRGTATTGLVVDPLQIGIELFGRYAIAVELASMLLLAGLIGAYHLGRRQPQRS